MRKTTKLGLAGFLAAVVNVTGCASPFRYEAESIPQIPFESCSYKWQDDRLKVGIEPFETPSETSLFNKPEGLKDVIAEGFLPVYMTFRNRSGEEISFNPRATRFVDGRGKEWSYVSPEEASRRKKEPSAADVALTYMISPIGAAIGFAEAEKTLKQREIDYASKGFQSRQQVGPEDVSGFVFLRNLNGDLGGNFQNGTLHFYLDIKGKQEEISVKNSN